MNIPYKRPENLTLREEAELEYEIRHLEERAFTGDTDVSNILYLKAKKLEFTKISDEALVFLAQSGYDDAKEKIVLRYIDRVKEVVSMLISQGRYSIGYDKEDLIQAGYMGFYEAIDDFKPELRKPFDIFSSFVIKRYINNIISKSNNGKSKALNRSLSYQSPINESEDSTFEQILKTEEYYPEEIAEKKELFYEIWNKLSDKEKNVLWYYAKDYSYVEIGEKLFGETELNDKQKIRAVDNAIQRINKKRDKYLEELKNY